MNYWHMQLHPGDKLSNDKVKKLLCEFNVIGMTEKWENDRKQPEKFKNSINIGDIVLIRNTPFLALVQVSSECHKKKEFFPNEYQEIWFEIARKVEVLDISENNQIQNEYKENTDSKWTDGIFASTTLERANNNKFIEWWYEKYKNKGCKLEFVQWLRENPKANYYDNNQDTVIKALDTYNNYFPSNIFNVNTHNVKKITEEIIKVIYSEETNSFLDFSEKEHHHRPRAILGNNNYLKFLSEKFSKDQIPNITNLPLNTILYGPPGTGKTYNTILKAAEIIENRKIDSYNEALDIFKANLHNQIEFITFHQNYSYEDFIQGLRPETDNKSSLVFNKKDGVFKKIADKALENLKLVQKAPNELFSEAKFNKALELFSNKVLESEDNFKVNDTAYIFEVEEDAFRYTGEKWTNHTNGLRMKFSDLREFYRNKVESRKDVKNLSSISGLAYQHATYYYLIYAEIIKHLPEKAEEPQKVTRKNFVIIIDEINRANISRVFGELITLIEPDKRSHGTTPLEATLPSGDIFVVPSNLFIIGTMNTADKSIALLDIALRRRFEFESMYPKYEIDRQEVYDVKILKKINEQIIKSKGHDFQIGHAYFMGKNNDLIERMNKKVIPLLLEYYMNDDEEVKSILNTAGLKIEDHSWPLKISGKNDESF